MKSRKGLSTIIGAVFFVIIFSSTIAYVAYSMDLIDTLAKSVGVKQSLEIDRANEEFKITKVQLVNNKFNITVQNTGNIPINITRLWTENVTATDWVSKHDINKIVTPGVTTTNIGQNIVLTALDTVGYDMKLVTERGTVNTFSINSVNQAPLDLKFHALPDLVPTAFTTTLMLTVRNDLPNSNLLLNLEPDVLGVSKVCEDTTICNESKVSGPFPTSIDILRPGDIGTFKWIYQLNGRVDDIWTFTGSLKNGVAGNTVTVTSAIQEIESSNIAGQSISTLGLSSEVFQTDILFFHDESGFTPGGHFQMDPLAPNGPGLVVVQDSGSGLTKFITNDIVIDDMKIPAGNWNASLRYNSEYLPPGMTGNVEKIWKDGDAGGHIFHFNENSVPIEDSVQDKDCWELTSSGNAGNYGDPTWGATFGVNGTGAFHFDGNGDYIRIDEANNDDECNQVRDKRFTMAGWFNATKKDSYDTRQVLWRSEKDSDKSWYEMSIGDGTSDNHGVVFFRWQSDDSGSNNLMECKSDKPGTSGYMDEKWHHFVGLKQNDNDCKCRLYIDAVQKDDQENGSCTSADLRNEGDVYIGRNPVGSEEFEGRLDDLMFWDYEDLSGGEVTALKQANYGADAHKINFVIDHVDENGTSIVNLATTNSYSLPFLDQKHETDRQILWVGKNYTTVIGNVTLSESTGDRITFSMEYDAGMNMRFLIDDGNLFGPASLLSSYLQPPKPDRDFTNYIGFDNDDEILLFIYNQGSVGTWLTYQGTRVVFSNVTQANSYSGMIKAVNDTSGGGPVDENTDSLFIPSNTKAQLTFWPPQVIPKAQTAGEPLKIPAGRWDTFVFISGYTEEGKTFLKTVNLGKMDVSE